MKKAFTLAEVMIVLTVIGVLTAILLPVARQSMPDENLMKFKKAHNTLGTVIRELVTSDKYYLNGDLGKRTNGDLIDGTHEGDLKYLCSSIADLISAKKVECSEYINGVDGAGDAFIGKSAVDSVDVSIEAGGQYLDEMCRRFSVNIGEEIILNDSVVIFQTAPNIPFGITLQQFRGQTYDDSAIEECISEAHTYCSLRMFADPHAPRELILFDDDNGFDFMYKPICIDIDGIHPKATADDCVNECPFGYGIRADGKIVAGARAQQWLEREVNEE